MKLELDAILKIMDHFDQSKMTSFIYETEEESLYLESAPQAVVEAVPAIPQATTVVEHELVAPATKTEGTVIKSPLVGTFYSAKAEGAEPFVSVGDTVTKGQVIGIVEAMKLMNEIESEADGVVAEILVENEQLVEFGQPLIRLK